MSGRLDHDLFADVDEARRLLRKATDGIAPEYSADRLALLWQNSREFLDHNFVTVVRHQVDVLALRVAGCERRARQELHQRFWEMETFRLFTARGWTPEQHGRAGNAPDFRFTRGGATIWVECVAPGAGTGESAADPLVELEPSHELHSLNSRVKLRITNSLDGKRKKIDEYVSNGVLSRTDTVVVALNLALIVPRPIIGLDDDDFDISGYPLVVAALFGIGAPAVTFDLLSRRRPVVTLQQKRKIMKGPDSPVSLVGFVDHSLEPISAVLVSRASRSTTSDDDASSLLLVSNPTTTRPLPSGWLSACREYHRADNYVASRKWQ